MTEQPDADTPAHALPAGQVLAGLGSRSDGLRPDEVEQRRQRYGSNRLPAPVSRGFWLRFARQFDNLLIYLLLVAAIITAILGHWLDTAVIVAVVLINAVIGVIQEGKAERALDAIRDLLSPRAEVIRGGQMEVLEASELVPGDIVRLRSGDKVPADLRLLRTRELRIEEAALTGESVPVDKQTAAVAADAPLGDRVGMAWSGTLVRTGSGVGVVVATGSRTEIGRISRLLESVEAFGTPLLRNINRFGRRLAAAILVLAVSALAVAIGIHGEAPGAAFLAAVGFAVAAIPEGLPAILTITLAIGVQRMAGRQAIIRQLPAVETLGSVTVICSDKTGTLTCNEMTTTRLLLPHRSLRISGVGYAPTGEFLDEQDRVLTDTTGLEPVLQAAVHCNDARVFHTGEDWVSHGDPTEAALLTLALKAGVDPDACSASAPRLDTLPFESEHRFMATLHARPSGSRFVVVKGAPEQLLARCALEQVEEGTRPLDPTAWQTRMDAAADAGERLLALAWKPVPDDQEQVDFAHVEDGLILLAVVGLIDPPSEQALAAVAACQRAGIRVVMITGDHARTAAAIGRQLGIGDGGRVVTGAELTGLDHADLDVLVAEVPVFARASPEHKLRLVQALQRRGDVVAMTGDGVNDAPALKRADVGVAMGRKGTEVAKEASAMVLADDNFASIAHAVEEGRTVYDNLRKTLLFLLPTNGGQGGVILLAVLAGWTLPITPVQILWVNMVTAVTLGLALAFEPTEPGTMRRAPRPPDEPILGPLLLWRIGLVSLLLVLVTGGAFVLGRALGDDALARTLAVNTLVIAQAFYLLSARLVSAPAWDLRLLRQNPWVPLAIGAILLLQQGFTYLPVMQQLFGTTALAPGHWLGMLGVGLVVFLIVEGEKRWVTRNWR